MSTTKPDHLSANARALKREFEWFREVLYLRFKLYFQQGSELSSIYDLPVPETSEREAIYDRLISHYQMNHAERLVLLLALAPHVLPQALDLFFTKNSLYDRGYSEFGGLVGQAHGGFLPTGETALFLLAGDDLEYRFRLLSLFSQDHFLYKHNILRLASEKQGEPFLSGALRLSDEYLTYFTTGDTYRPNYSSNFPARRIHTGLEWKDLVVDSYVTQELEEIIIWIEKHETIRQDWGLGDRIKPGFRSLFYGPPGTGKTLAASLLGKHTGREVYRIDLSQVVSKYIGETEKNLANVFDQAEFKNWILFFDEADALFGKRTSTKDAKDRYANQEIAYLLQRIEDFPGVVLLATNMKGNIDEAFSRRFQSMIYFPMPDVEKRHKLWMDTFGNQLELAPDVDLSDIARRYELAGGAIVNVLRYCALTAARRGNNKIQNQDVLAGIRKELRKEGKTV